MLVNAHDTDIRSNMPMAEQHSGVPAPSDALAEQDFRELKTR